MRINIYHHEIEFMASRATSVSKIADTGITYHGIRLPTEPERIDQPGDDDSAAITLWFPTHSASWKPKGTPSTHDMRRIGEFILAECDALDV